jgi:molybdopterin converting factor small subunit
LKVKIKLFATLTKYLPPDAKNRTAELDTEEGTTTGQLLDQLEIPAALAHLTMINGHQESRDYVLQPDDLLTVFPQVAGG